MLSRWRRVLAFLAFLSLFATWAPSFAWACPMTGQVGTQPEICRVMGLNSGAPMACCLHNQQVQTSTARLLAVSVGDCCHLIVANRSLVFTSSGAHRFAPAPRSSNDLTAVLSIGVNYSHTLLLVRPLVYQSGASPPPTSLSLSQPSGRAPPA